MLGRDAAEVWSNLKNTTDNGKIQHFRLNTASKPLEMAFELHFDTLHTLIPKTRENHLKLLVLSEQAIKKRTSLEKI